MSGERVLIVEDDDVLCEAIAEMLKEEGYSVKNISETNKAINTVKEENFDIAIFDYKMQDLTGSEILKIVKNRNPGTKVFIMSGKPFIEKVLEEEAVSHLISGIISKPFDGNKLLEKIKSGK